MFIDILRSAENSAKVIKEVITYKADGNGIKTVKKVLLSLAEVYHDNSIKGLFADATEPENNGIIIYKDFNRIEYIKTENLGRMQYERKRKDRRYGFFWII